MLSDLIRAKKAKVGIVGLGYVGLPLAAAFAAKGYSTTGFEIDVKKVSELNRGFSYVPDVPSDGIKRLRSSGAFIATADFGAISHMDAIIICVPTPLRKTKNPDMSYIIDATQKILPRLRKNQLVVLESTTYPGTTREMLLPEIEKKGFKAGKDIYLAFSPERIDPGNKKYNVTNMTKIVGGITPACTNMAAQLYRSIVDRVVPVSSTECAEMVKLLENTFRAVNIGLVNEVALMCDRLNLDCWEVIEAAATKPFGFMPFYPGPGIGGHCIPLDPHYLSWKLKSLNFYSRFIELAGEINSAMPEYLVRKIADALNSASRSVKGSKILILGVAYKKDVGDTRESPALDVIKLLEKKRAVISYHDPYVKSLSLGAWKQKSVNLSPKVLKKYDCVVITTNHSCFQIETIVKNSRLVVDSRNATRGIASKNIVKL